MLPNKTQCPSDLCYLNLLSEKESYISSQLNFNTRGTNYYGMSTQLICANASVRQ